MSVDGKNSLSSAIFRIDGVRTVYSLSPNWLEECRCQCPLIQESIPSLSAFLIERGFRDVIENLKLLNSKYLETLQIIVWWVATAKFSNGCGSFFTSEFTHSLNKIENIYLKIYSCIDVSASSTYTTMT